MERCIFSFLIDSPNIGAGGALRVPGRIRISGQASHFLCDGSAQQKWNFLSSEDWTDHIRKKNHKNNNKKIRKADETVKLEIPSAEVRRRIGKEPFEWKNNERWKRKVFRTDERAGARRMLIKFYVWDVRAHNSPTYILCSMYWGMPRETRDEERGRELGVEMVYELTDPVAGRYTSFLGPLKLLLLDQRYLRRHARRASAPFPLVRIIIDLFFLNGNVELKNVSPSAAKKWAELVYFLSWLFFCNSFHSRYCLALERSYKNSATTRRATRVRRINWKISPCQL